MGPFFASIFPLFPRNAWYSGYNSSYPFDTSSLSLAQDDKHQIEAMLMQWWEWAWGRYWYHFLSPRDGIKRGGANVVRVVSLILAGNTVENEELETDRWTHWKWNCSTHSANRVCISQEIWIKRNFYFARTLFSRTLCCMLSYISFRVQVTTVTKVVPLCSMLHNIRLILYPHRIWLLRPNNITIILHYGLT